MIATPARLLAEAQSLHQAGRLAAAAQRYEELLKRRPDDSTVLALLGALRLQQADALAASKLLRRAADRRPDDPTPRYNLGIALNRLRRHGEAAQALEAVVAAHPDHADAWKSLGDARHARDDRAGAIRAWQSALAVRPDHAGALLNLGAALLAEGQALEAERCARKLLALRPEDPQGFNNLGLALMAQRRMAEAEIAYRRAIEIAPKHDKAVENLARLLMNLRRVEEALSLFEQALGLQRESGQSPSANALVGLLEARGLLFDWRGLGDAVQDVLAHESDAPDPFILLAHDVAPRRLQRLGLLHGRKEAAGVVPLPTRRPARGNRIRIGYLSADFRDHAVTYLIAEALELHDRDAFAVHAYATSDRPDSRMRARIATGIEAFHSVHDLGEDALARRIAADEIDILVDLGGWTANHRARTLAMRPAPIQASWLGYAASLGVPWIDYAILDPVAAPPGCERDFSEQLVRLPDCFQPNDRQRAVGPTPSRAEAGLPDSGFVFAAFATAFKITPAVWDAWMHVLNAAPDSLLWMKDLDPPARKNLCREAEARGVDANRIVFAPHVLDHAAHLARYGVADLALDTWPYGSHTTASDALWAGCPLIALRGETLASRISSSVLHAAGLPDLVTDSADAFVALAVQLAQDAPALAALRARVAACRASQLFDTPRFVRHLEAAYRAMHARAVDGLTPAPISIAPLR